MHLADGANMFHVKRPMPSRRAMCFSNDGSGEDWTYDSWSCAPFGSKATDWNWWLRQSMPRRYPKWEEGPAAGRYFKDESAGGLWRKLGWRCVRSSRWWSSALAVPTVEAGRYRNTFLNGERSLWINSSDKEAIAQRTDDFSNFVRPPSPEEQQRVALDLVESARAHLSRYPASCSARKNREAAFEELRTVNQMHFGLSPDATDAQYRVLDDYVLKPSFTMTL